MHNIQLVDYNDLFVIAVGISMAYIVIEIKGCKSYLSILAKITTAFKDWLLKLKTKPQQAEEAIITKIDYYLESGLLNERTIGALSNISARAKKEVNKIKYIEQWTVNKLKFHTKADFLNVISCDCFLFGIFVLFIGTFQNKECMNIDGLLQITLLAMNLLTLHCIWFERLELQGKWITFIRPNIPLHALCLLIALIFGIKYMDQPFISNIDSGLLAVISVFTCFIGFIVYLLLNILSNIILAIVFLFKILFGISHKKGKEHSQELREYDEELNEIDQRLKKIDLSKSMSITSNSESQAQN